MIEENEQIYVLGDTLYKDAPIYCKGTKNTRELVKKKGIKSFIYGKQMNNNWIKSDGASMKFDKVFIREDIIKEIKTIDDIDMEEAPEIIDLINEEKFKDDDGKIIEIGTRGKREYDKIYFKVKDVSEGFGIKTLQDTIIRKESKYIINKHYKYFIIKTEDICKKKVKKDLYLTYEGILRVLFVSENNKTSKFITWVTKTVFTVQMGNIIQKNKLVSKIKGVSYESIQELFSVNARTLPCIYLTNFNTVDKLRRIMNINDEYIDDDMVCKFGMGKSFETRKNGHKSEYKELEEYTDMRLIQFSFIDPLYISEAENELSELLNDYKLEYKNHNELIIIPKKMMNIIKSIYEKIGMKYSGHTTEFNKKVEELNKKINNLEREIEINKLKHENEIKDYDNKLQKERYDKEIQKERYENELLKKELEMLKMKGCKC